MKKTRSKVLCALAALLGAFFVLFCVAGFAACGGSKETTRFEAEEAALSADESDMMDELSHNLIGGYIEPFVFNVQEDENASGGKVVGYLCESSPSITFNITASKAKSATLTLRGASAYLSEQDLSNWMGLAGASILEYKGSEHDILTVNGESVALSGSLPAADSVFDDNFNLNVSNWGEMTAKIDLKEGANQIVITYDNIGLGVDYIEIETAAELTYTATDNSNFSNVPGTSSGGSTGGTTGGTTGDETSSTYTAKFEAEDAGLFNAQGKKDSNLGNLLKEETLQTATDVYRDSPSVGNFNTSGDKIVFQVYASDAVEGVTMEVNAGTAIMSGLSLVDYVGADHPILTVNDTSYSLSGTIAAASGTILSAGTYGNSFGTLTATGISLVEGVNYIVFTCDGYGLNMDNIVLGWEDYEVTTTDATSGETTTTTVTPTVTDISVGEEGAERNSASTSIVKTSDADTTTTEGSSVLTLEAEDAGLMNYVGKTNQYFIGMLTSGVMGIETIDEDDGITSVSNFKTGDQIVFAVYADEAISNVSLTVKAATASYTTGVTMTAETGIISVNGSTDLTVTGSLEANRSYNNWMTLSVDSTVSLVEGVNYIVLTCGSSAINVDGITLTFGTASPEA